MKLQIGTGNNYKEGWVNADFNKDVKADVYFDLEKFPYPFEDNTFEYIYADNVIEHLEDLIKVMEELHRISKDKAIIKIIVPHYSGHGAFSHLTHKRYFGSGTFSNFKPSSWEKYSDVEFNVLKVKLKWFCYRNWILMKPFNFIIEAVANWNILLAERFHSFVGGFEAIEYELEVIK